MKNYLIIGGSTGIGKSVVEELVLQNHRVFATFHTHPLENNRATYFHLDCTENSFDLSFLPQTLHGLVFCPGSINLKPFHRFTSEDFLRDYQFQVISAIKIIQQVLPLLKNAENASVVLFSTVAVQTGMPFHSLVSASKGAIEGLTRSLAAEYAPGIRFNAIAPSLTDTPLASFLLNKDEKIQAAALRHPLKRIGKAEEIAKAVVYFLSDDSSWISGQIFKIDGGISSIKN